MANLAGQVKSWVYQPTTAAGAMAIAGAISGALSHAMTPGQAIVAGVVGLAGLIWPMNSGAKGAVKELATLGVEYGPTIAHDVEALVESYRMGLKHGAATAVPPAPAPNDNAKPSATA